MRISLGPRIPGVERLTPTRCLLVDRGDSLLLVDAGVGALDIARPRRRMGAIWVAAARPLLDPSETARKQVESLGYDPELVRDIVLTHMDLDHIGGVSDFPNAVVHVSALEYELAHKRRLPGMQQGRYRRGQWNDHQHWNIHDRGDRCWFGIDGSTDVTPDGNVVLIPLPGHSRGHSGVAIHTGNDNWVLHAGDAFMLRQQLHEPRFRLPVGIAAFEFAITADRSGHKRTLEHLRRLRDRENVHILCTHDPHQEKIAPAVVN
jgi:glyoxylase-like metal-dependent hydrolase (beta-lactamase superfamily II)